MRRRAKSNRSSSQPHQSATFVNVMLITFVATVLPAIVLACCGFLDPEALLDFALKIAVVVGCVVTCNQGSIGKLWKRLMRD